MHNVHTKKHQKPLNRENTCPRWDSNRTLRPANTDLPPKHTESAPVRHLSGPVRSPGCGQCPHPIFTVPERRTPRRRDAALVSTGRCSRCSTVEARTRLNPRAVEAWLTGRSDLPARRIFTASTSPQSSHDRIPGHPPDPVDEPDLCRYGHRLSATRRLPPGGVRGHMADCSSGPPRHRPPPQQRSSAQLIAHGTRSFRCRYPQPDLLHPPLASPLLNCG